MTSDATRFRLYTGRSLKVTGERVSFGPERALEKALAEQLHRPFPSAGTVLPADSPAAAKATLQSLEIAAAWTQRVDVHALAAFERRGLACRSEHDGVHVDSRLAVPYAGPIVDLEKLVDDCVGEVISKHVRTVFEGLLTDRIEVVTEGPNVRIVGPIGPIAEIQARLAVVNGAWPFAADGDFLAPGRQWDGVVRRSRLELRRCRRLMEARVAALALVQPARQPARLPAAASGGVPNSGLTIDEVPPGIVDALRARCLQASESIRLSRNAAYSNPVALKTPSYSIVLLPVREGDRGVPVVPYRFEAGELSVRGHLRLRASSDPLPIYALVPDDFRLTAELWAAVLLGYEVISVLRTSQRPDAARSSTRWEQGRRDRRGPRRGRTEIPRRREISEHLTAVGRAAVAHWVVGHVRELSEGMRCSDDALREAQLVGIELAPGQTWVRPHARGLARDEELTFRWTVPEVAARLLR
ncbi:MAG: hypothetical protein AB7I38_15940 [Dehalococcoidia bacterium]